MALNIVLRKKGIEMNTFGDTLQPMEMSVLEQCLKEESVAFVHCKLNIQPGLLFPGQHDSP